MKKMYQVRPRNATGNSVAQLPLPLEDFVDGVREDIEALAGDCGLFLILRIMEAERERLCGARYAHDGDRRAFRHGFQDGYVVFAGRKVDVKRPRVVSVAGKEIPLPTYRRFQRDGRMQRAVSTKIVHGLTARKYEKVLEDLVEGYGVKKSSVSRHFIRATANELQTLMERSLSDLSLCALMLDGIEFAGVVLIVALGVDASGKKHILGLWQGSTENAVVCKALLDDLIRRGLDPKNRILIAIDGSKALRKAVENVFGKDACVQRCRLHKRRNVRDHLPPEHQTDIDRRLRAAYQMREYREAKQSLLTVVRHLERLNPSAARSLQEGLEETLTVNKLGLPEVLRQSFSTTNLIESAFSIVRNVTRNVTRWQGGDHVQRWAAAGLLFAEKKFRRVKGYRFMRQLVEALRPGLDEMEKAA